jgi:hypothetical protein
MNNINFYNNINNLPNEIKDYIKEYIPLYVYAFLNKTFYLENHKFIRKYIDRYQIENYIRNTIRRDNEFVFLQILKENYKKWLEIKKYEYKWEVFSNYLYFISSYALENESYKCFYLVNDLLEEIGLNKNQHKKNSIKHIRWKT